MRRSRGKALIAIERKFLTITWKMWGGYEMGHKYCRKSYTGLKDDYILLQMVCVLNQLVEKGRFVSRLLKQHSIIFSRNRCFFVGKFGSKKINRIFAPSFKERT
jgi:hypothetical protein